MSIASQRDRVCDLAKRDAGKALKMALSIPDPWFRSQALAYVARYTEEDPIKIAKQAAKAAGECDDEYKKTAVRAWEIAALAERKFVAEARNGLQNALSQSRGIMPLSSRAEALMLLLHAALRIGDKDARRVVEELKASCSDDSHWRCKRAIRDAEELAAGKREPRPFFR
jgi:hypothetical protein